MATYEQQEFLDELSKETQRVLTSKHGLWIENLSRWFDVIDSFLEARLAVDALESGVDFDGWEKLHRFAIETRGSSQIRFPRDRRDSLGIRLRMFRSILDGKFEISSFGLYFLGVFAEQDVVTAMSQDIFSPMVEDLNKYLTAFFESPDKVIPAADRIVPLDHNSISYKEAIEAAEEFQRELTKTNVDLEDKGRLISEVSAGITLLKGPSVNTAALKSTLIKATKYVAEKASDHAIGILATALIGLITAWLGLG